MRTDSAARSVCALTSGGLDSCALVVALASRYRRVYPLFVRQGLADETHSLRALERFLSASRHPGLEALTVLERSLTSLLPGHWAVTGRNVPGANTPDAAVYLPGRNLLLLGEAAVFSAQRGITTIAMGTLGRNPFADASPGFFREFGRLASTALEMPIRVTAPFRTWDKPTVIRRFRHCPLSLSFSCLAPRRGRHCGRCNKCAERRRAFADAGVTDETGYAAVVRARR